MQKKTNSQAKNPAPDKETGKVKAELNGKQNLETSNQEDPSARSSKKQAPEADTRATNKKR